MDPEIFLSDPEQLKCITIKVSEALFSGHREFELGGDVYAIGRRPGSDVRFARIRDVEFVEQDKAKRSKLAERAQNGTRILWVLWGGKQLARYENGEVNIYSQNLL